MSQKQDLDEMLRAWEASCRSPASSPLPQRFFDVRKRATPRKIHSTGGLTPEGEAMRARELGLDKEKADPIIKMVEIGKMSWVPTGEPGSYEGRRYSQPDMGEGNDDIR